MLSLALLTFLASTTLSNPLPAPSSQETYLTACTHAKNCELYTRPDGTKGTRFIPGTEPGTSTYTSHQAHTKRDGTNGYPKTQVTIGDHQIAWGCDVDPVKELDHLSDSCKTSGQCDDSDPYERDVGYLNVIDNIYAGPVSTPMKIEGRGNYPIWMRNGLVQAIQAAAGGKDVINWHRKVHWNKGFKGKRETPGVTLPNGPNNSDPSSGVCDVAVLSSHIGLNVYSAADTLEATMEATITLPKIDEQKGGFCSIKPATDLGAAVSGALGEAGAGLAAIFGSVSAFCG